MLVRVTPLSVSDLAAHRQSFRTPEGRGRHPSVMHSGIRYARNGDVHLAYRVFGDGPTDIILVPGTVSHVELFWELPVNVYLLKRLSALARVIVFDKRGQGLSDRVAAQTIEERIDDVRAVMDAVGSQRATIYGWSEGGLMSIMFAARYPERTAGLVLYGAYASIKAEPWSVFPEQFERFLSSLGRHWGEGILVKVNAPSRMYDDVFVEWFARLERAVASPGTILSLMRANYGLDARPLLNSLRVPTLVFHRQGDALVPVQAGRYLAWHIPQASYFELPGGDHLLQAFDLEVLDMLIDRIQELMTGSHCGVPNREVADRREAFAPRSGADVLSVGRKGPEALIVSEPARSNGGVNWHHVGAAKVPAGAVFQREGEYWTLAWQGNLMRLRDAKGLHYINYLLANAGRYVPAVELANAGKTAPATLSSIENGRTVAGLGDAGEVLDAVARARYRGRITELREELAEAEQLNDSGRVHRLRWELEQLGDQIAAAVGLRGQARTIASHRERARLTVTKAIKAAIVKVRSSDAALGHHLATCVKTGNLCTYDPGPAQVPWRL
jgi:pimeloyl-ACP methyl ester carboxylesterase